MLTLKPLFWLIAFLGALYFSLVITAASTGAPVMQLAIPAINLSEPVYPVEIIDKGSYLIYPVLDNNVAWHNLSAPAGAGGNTVLNGHSNKRGMVFRDLHQVKEGEPVYLVVQSQVYTYWIRQRFLVQEEGVSFEQRRLNGKWIGPTEDERLTIVTCAEGTRYRLIVVAFP